MDLTVEQLEAISRIVTGPLVKEVEALRQSTEALKDATRHEFSMLHGRVQGVGDDVKALDKRINGRLTKAETVVAELATIAAVNQATKESDEEAAAKLESAITKVAITKSDVAKAGALVGGVTAVVYGTIEFINKLGPFLVKLAKAFSQ